MKYFIFNFVCFILFRIILFLYCAQHPLIPCGLLIRRTPHRFNIIKINVDTASFMNNYTVSAIAIISSIVVITVLIYICLKKRLNRNQRNSNNIEFPLSIMPSFYEENAFQSLHKN